MKILHTSDLHLGHTLYGHSRMMEQEDMLRQIVEIVLNHQPDAVVICGDIFDTTQPGAEPSKKFNDFLVELRRVAPSLVVVCTAGNHDSASRHEAFSTPWSMLQVYTIGQVKSGYLPEDYVITLPGKGHIVAAPYVNERSREADFYLKLLSAVPTDDLPVVMLAHTTVMGCDFTGHNHSADDRVGTIEAITLESMGVGYDYLALGHIHRPQFVKGSNKRARYSGTPLPIHFDEVYPQLNDEPFQHSVSLVEIPRRGARPVVTPLEIVNAKPLVTIPSRDTFDEWNEIVRKLNSFTPLKESFIRLNVKMSSGGALPASAKELALQSIDRKEPKCTFCFINSQREQPEANGAIQTISIQELHNMTPLEVAKRYATDHGETFDDTLIALFEEAVAELNKEKHED